MLKLPKSVRIFFATSPVDMRKQMNGLAIVVREGLGRNPRSGEMFVFRNRRGDMARVLFFDQQGYCLLSKRLERGTFARPVDLDDDAGLELRAEELALFLTAANPWSIADEKRIASKRSLL